MKNPKRCFVLFFSLVCGFITYAQPQFDEQWAYPYNANYSALSLKVDLLNRPYVYVASNEGGLIILSVDGQLVTQIKSDEIGLPVMNLDQDGNLLFLALGGHFGDGPAGVGVVDITDPDDPKILSVWNYDTPRETDGMGIVVCQGDYLFAGAMGRGLIILDKSDPANLELIGELELDINYPHPNPSNPALYNARGMDVVNDLVYLTFDAGGLRIIDVTDPTDPRQVGAFANPITFQPFNRPRAYNNVKVIGDVAYIAVDYCGLEAVNIADPTDIKLLDHYNPINCPEGSWFNAAVHTNELVYDDKCEQLFITGGKTDLIAVDITDPEHLIPNGSFGTIKDTTATWGIAMRNDSIYLGYLIIPIYVPFLHPYDAKWSGVKMISVDYDCLASTEEKPANSIKLYPNPSEGTIFIELERNHGIHSLMILDALGHPLHIQKAELNNVVSVPDGPGIYFLKAIGSNKSSTFRVIIF